jgi:hypothetical protein
MGKNITTPTNKNFKLFSGAAACQISSDGGTILGNMLIINPIKDNRKRKILHKKGCKS